MKLHSFKKLLLPALSLIAAGFILMPQTAEASHRAGDTRGTGNCGSCDGRLYERYAVTGYRRGYAVYDWAPVIHYHVYPHGLLGGIFSGIFGYHGYYGHDHSYYHGGYGHGYYHGYY